MPDLANELESAIPFPASIPEEATTVGLGSTLGIASGVAWITVDEYDPPATGPANPTYYGEIVQERYWLVRDNPSPIPLTLKFLEVTECTINDEETIEVEVVPLTIPALQTSVAHDLKPNFVGPESDPETHDEWVTMRLLPVEILVPEIAPDGTETGNLVQAKELRVAKMEQSLDANGDLDIDNDPDRFYVRITGAQNFGAVSIHLGTTGNPDAAYNDDATEIDLTTDPNGGALISPSQLLVADTTDDDYSGNGVGTDDAKNDRTHLVQLGGNVTISSITIAGSPHMAGINTPVKVRKTVTVKLVNCIYGLPLLKGPSWPAGYVSTTTKALKERYAQVGIKVDVTEVAGPDIGLTGNPRG